LRKFKPKNATELVNISLNYSILYCFILLLNSNLSIFQEHNDRCLGLINKDFAKCTVDRYITSKNHIAEFIKLKYNKSDMVLNDIKPMFVSDFEYFLKTNKDCCNNSTIKHLKSL